MTKLVKLVFTIVILGSFSTSASAMDKGAALKACATHIKALHPDGARTRMKKIRKKSGYMEVKMKVNAGDKPHMGTCKIMKTGELTYSTDIDV